MVKNGLQNPNSRVKNLSMQATPFQKEKEQKRSIPLKLQETRKE